MRCIETAKTFASEVLKKIKSNMRCIETILAAFLKTGRGAIKSNMRCIETYSVQTVQAPQNQIKSNMRCIETGAEGSLCARHYW